MILVNISGNIIYESEVNDVPTLLAESNTASVWNDSGIVNTTLMGVTVFNVGSDLFLSVHDKGIVSSVPASLKLYKSVSGNGGDWVLYSVVQSIDFTGNYWPLGENLAMTGTITVLENGTWIMPGVNFEIVSTNYLKSKIAIYTSNDFGITWTYRTWFGEGLNAGGATYYTGDMPKNIVQTSSGNLYAVTNRDYAGLYVYVRKSIDNGLTWTKVLTIDTMANPPVPPFERWDADLTILDNGFDGFFILTGKYTISGVGNYIYEISDPDNDINNIVKVKTFTRLYGTNTDHASAVAIDGYLITTRGSYVTGVPEL